MANLEQISEQKATWADEGQRALGLINSERIIKRKWTQINSLYLAELAEVIRHRASVKNPANARCCFVKNPLVNGLTYPGTWRSTLVETTEDTKETGTIVQTLNFGWATSLIDSEARLVGGDNIPLQPERFLQRQYVALDFTKIGDMIESIESTKYVTNPVIEGKTYDGPIVAPATTPSDLKWRILSSKPSRAADGSGIITQTLAKNLVISDEDLPTPILLSDDKALLSPFAHDTTSEKNIYVWEYRWIDPVYAQTLRDTIALTSDVIDAKAIKADDGSFNIQVLTHTNTWEGTLSQEWEHQTRHPTFAANQIVNTYSHIALTSLEAFKTTLGTATAGYKVSALVDSTDATGGFATIVQTQDKLFVGTVSADNGTTTEEEYLQLITSGVIRTTLWLGVPDDDLAAAMTTLSTAPSGYTVVRVGHNYNGTGSANVIRTMMTKGDSSAEQVRIEFPSFESERITYHYLGLDKTTADALYVTLQTTCDVGYKVDIVNIIEWKLALAVVQQISKVQVTPFDTSAVHQQVYTHAFGLVTRATTVYLNVPFAEIDTVKDAINALADVIILDIADNDNGHGSADITYNWRTKEAAPRALGSISSVKPSQFHQEAQERLWIDINLTDKDALATAVALALAGTAPYAVDAGDTIQSANGQDAGDKTGIIRQKLSKKPDSYTVAEYQTQVSFNPHGLKEATMLVTVNEYPEIAYADLDTIFSTLQTFLGDPMKGSIQVSLNGNGTFMMRGLKEGTPDWDNATPNYVQMGIQNPGVIGESKTEQATGVPVADAAAIVAAAIADTDYALDSIRMTERSQGEASIEKQQTLKSETAVIIRAFPAIGTQRATEERIWPVVLSANLDTVWTAALTEGVTDDYVLKYRHRQYLGGGKWRVANWVEAATEVEVAAFTSEDDANGATVVERKQDSAAIPDAENSTGVNVSVTGALNALNKYDYDKSTRTAESQEVSGSYADRNGTTYFWSGTLCTAAQYNTAIAAASLDSTTDNSVEKSTTQFVDLFNYSIVKRAINTFWISASAASYGPYTEIGLDWKDDRSKYRKKTITFYIYWNTTENYNNDDYTGSLPGGWTGHDGNQWKCKKVTQIVFGSWTAVGTISF